MKLPSPSSPRRRGSLSVVSAWTGVVLVLCSFPLRAQTGTRIHRYDPAEINDSASLSPADRARSTMDRYASCLVDYNEPKVRRFLSMFPDKNAEDFGSRLASSECLGSGEMSFSATIFRGSLYKALYRKEFGKSGVAINGASIDYAAEAKDFPAEVAGPYIALRQFAECVVVKDVPQSREITLAAAGSQREKAGFAALSPLFGPCLQQGVNVTFSKQVLGGLIAETLYRLSTYPERAAGSH